MLTHAENEKPPPSSSLILFRPKPAKLIQFVSSKGPGCVISGPNRVVVVERDVVVVVSVVDVSVVLVADVVDVVIVELVLVRVTAVEIGWIFCITQLGGLSNETCRSAGDAISEKGQRKMSPGVWSQPAS
mmetsp:Transcript_95001/g.305906  ORF Transcript_95001/g.305906 Transcript_95001/m.305906 type:complete len:130 (-) Transcript_95001:3-392(-)